LGCEVRRLRRACAVEPNCFNFLKWGLDIFYICCNAFFMEVSTIDEQMANYFMQLNEAEKKTVLTMIKTFLQGRNDLPVEQDLDEYDNDIVEAIAEVENGEFYSHNEVVSMSKNW